MITNRLTYFSFISLFLVQEIFSDSETLNNNNQNDRIQCRRVCVMSILTVFILIVVAGTIFALIRCRKNFLRQRTGHIEEIVAHKCKLQFTIRKKNKIK
jgi:hypothetical protein